MSWQHPATLMSCSGNQARSAGSETRRRSVDGCVCLGNSPSPCESRSHLSGSPRRECGSQAGAPFMAVAPRSGGVFTNRHLSIGNFSSHWSCSRQGLCYAPSRVFRCRLLFLLQPWVGTALARQLPSLPFPLSYHNASSLASSLPPPLPPLPLLLPCQIPFFLDALPVIYHS
jgi:hypothetical protein